MTKKKKLMTIPTISAAAVAMVVTPFADSNLQGASPFSVKKAHAAGFAGGTGTTEDPYQISTADQLRLMGNAINGHFILVNDIDVNNERWTPFGGTGFQSFNGTFDGKGFKIKNLNIHGTLENGTGLFKQIGNDAVLKNFILQNVYVNGNGYSEVGALTGRAAGGVFENIKVIGNNIIENGKDDVGGLIGKILQSDKEHGNVRDVFFEGKVTGTRNNVGGLIGTNGAGGSPIERSMTVAIVTGGGDRVGGIVGDTYYPISDAIFIGEVKGASRVGGIAGNVTATTGSPIKDIRNTFSFGTVNGTGGKIGGIVGSSSGGAIKNGFVFSPVIQTTSTGTTAKKEVGHLYGDASLSAKPLMSGYVSKKAGTVSHTSGVMGYIETSEEKDKSFYEKANLPLGNGVWDIIDGVTMPFLTFHPSHASIIDGEWVNTPIDTDIIYGEAAKEAVEKAERSKQLADVMVAQNLVNKLQDGAAKTDYNQRLTVVRTYIDANDAVKNAERVRTQVAVDAAQKLVDLVSNTADKKALQDRLDVIKQELATAEQKYQEALAAVKSAEDLFGTGDYSNAQIEKNKAQQLVDQLGNDTRKGALQERLDALQKKLDDELSKDQKYEEALAAVGKAEEVFATGNYAKAQEDKHVAQRLVDQLSDEDARKQALQDRLDALQTKIDETIQGEGKNQAAKDAVEKAERDQTQSSIDDARKLVEELPEGELRDELTDRLNDVQAELDVKNAEKEKFEQLKGQIQALQDGVKNGTIPSDEYENTRKQLENIRNEVQKLTSPSNKTELEQLIDSTLKLMDEQDQQLSEGPKNLQVVANSTNQVTITFDVVPHAAEYVIKRNGVIIAYTSETTFVDTNVLHNQTYQYEVVARNAHSTSQPSKASVSTPIQYRDVTLSWPPSKDVVGYKIYRDNELIGETEDTTFTDKKAVEGQNYKYRIEAIDNDGEVMALSASFEVLVEDDKTIEVDLTDKDKPVVPVVTNVKASADNKNMTITWDNFEEAKRYRVQPYVLDPLTGEFVKDGFARSTTTNSLVLNTLKPGFTYKFEVVPATNKFLEDSAGFSNEVSLEESKHETPSEDNTPSDSLTVKVEGKTTHLSWEPMADVTRYRVQLFMKDDMGQYVKSGAARAIAETTFSFTGLKEEHEYKFVIEPRVGFVYDANKALKGFAKISKDKDPTEPPKEEGSNPSAIKNVLAEMNGKTASLSWDALTVSGTDVTTYRIVRYVKDDVTGSFKSDGLSRTVTNTSYTDTYKLVSGKTYRYEITPRVGNRYATELTTTTDEYVNE